MAVQLTVQFIAENGKAHITVCGEQEKSYDASVPLNISLYLNPTQFYEPEDILSIVLTGFNKSKSSRFFSGGGFIDQASNKMAAPYGALTSDTSFRRSEEVYLFADTCPLSSVYIVCLCIL